MGPVWLALQTGLRSRWRPVLGLALLLGLTGGVVLTAAAGARRTDTAYPRLLRWANASDLLVTPAGNGFKGYFTALGHLKQVASMSALAYLDMALPVPGSAPDSRVVAEASPDGAAGVSVDRVKIVSGRLFNPADPHAVMIDQRLADMERLRPGGTLRLLGYPQKNGNRVGSRPVPLAFRVSAIAVFDDQIISSTKERAAPRALFSPAFARTPAARSFNPAGGGASVSLRPGADRAAFAHAASMLAARYRVGRIDIVNMTTNFAATERAIRPEAVALEIFAGLAGVIALAILAQLLSRQLLVDATEFPILRALGMTRPRLAALSIARAGAVTVA